MPPNPKPDKTHYDWLELAPDASDEAIKAAFRRLVRLHHPDLHHNSSHAEEHFKKINAAYQTLRQPESRQRYDFSLGLMPKYGAPDAAKRAYSAQKETPTTPESPSKKTAQAPPKAEQSNSASSNKEASPAQEVNVKPEAQKKQAHTQPKSSEDKEGWLRWMEDLLKTPDVEKVKPESKTVHKSAKTVKNGEDMTVEVSLNPYEAKKGLLKKLVLDWESPCHTCAGTGRINGRHCSACHGSGHKKESRKLAVQIPAGVKQGSRVRLLGEGEPSQGGGKAGDLYLKITLLNTDERLEVKDSDVYLTWPVSLPSAVLGTTLQVPTLHGSVDMVIPAGSQNGQILRLKSCGVKDTGKPAGDQWVTLQIEMPKKLNPEQKALYEALRQLET